MQFDVVDVPDAVAANEAARPMGPVVDAAGTEVVVDDPAIDGEVVLPEEFAPDTECGIAGVARVVVVD